MNKQNILSKEELNKIDNFIKKIKPHRDMFKVTEECIKKCSCNQNVTKMHQQDTINDINNK